jgi:hypothetical protein
MMTRDLSAARRGGGGALPFCELSFVMNDIIFTVNAHECCFVVVVDTSFHWRNNPNPYISI